MATQEDVIDIQALLEKAKPLVINLIAREWIEIEGNPVHYPATSEGRMAAENRLIAEGVTDEYVRQRKLHYKQEGRPMYDIVTELREKMTALGIEPQEGPYSFWDHDWREPEEQRELDLSPSRTINWAAQQRKDHVRPLPLNYRWVASYPVTGSNEGFYLHIDLIWQEDRRKTEFTAIIQELIAKVETIPYTAENYRPNMDLATRARQATYGQHTEYRRMLALAKTWSWDNACACAAVAATLLGA